MMLKRFFIVAVMLGALLLPQRAQGQVVDIGLSGGYSMNNETLRLKGSSTGTWLGVNHGFYAGGQFDFNLGKGLSVRTGVLFRKGGSDLYLDLEKIAVNLHQISDDLQGGNNQLADYLKTHPEVIDENLDPEEVEQYINDFEGYTDELLTTLKGTDVVAKVDRYSLDFPILLRYTSGRLSVNVGVNLTCLLFNKIDLKANVPGGIVYSGKDMETYLPYMDAVLNSSVPVGDMEPMSLDQFYRKDIAREFTVALQVGIDFAISDRVSLQASYIHGLRSELKDPWNHLFVLQDRSFQVGLVYHFYPGRKQ